MVPTTAVIGAIAIVGISFILVIVQIARRMSAPVAPKKAAAPKKAPRSIKPIPRQKAKPRTGDVTANATPKRKAAPTPTASATKAKAKKASPPKPTADDDITPPPAPLASTRTSGFADPHAWKIADVDPLSDDEDEDEEDRPTVVASAEEILRMLNEDVPQQNVLFGDELDDLDQEDEL